MASAAHTTVARALNSAAADWTSNPAVRRILTSFATHPPIERRLPRQEQDSPRDTEFTGYRVACLHAQRAAILNPAFLSAEAADDRETVAAILAQPTVFDVVDDALRIPTLAPVANSARQLDPAVWGTAL